MCMHVFMMPRRWIKHVLASVLVSSVVLDPRIHSRKDDRSYEGTAASKCKVPVLPLLQKAQRRACVHAFFKYTCHLYYLEPETQQTKDILYGVYFLYY